MMKLRNTKCCTESVVRTEIYEMQHYIVTAHYLNGQLTMACVIRKESHPYRPAITMEIAKHSSHVTCRLRAPQMFGTMSLSECRKMLACYQEGLNAAEEIESFFNSFETQNNEKGEPE